MPLADFDCAEHADFDCAAANAAVSRKAIAPEESDAKRARVLLQVWHTA